MSNIKIADLNTHVSQSLLKDLTTQEIDNIIGGDGLTININDVLNFKGDTIFKFCKFW